MQSVSSQSLSQSGTRPARSSFTWPHQHGSRIVTPLVSLAIALARARARTRKRAHAQSTGRYTELRPEKELTDLLIINIIVIIISKIPSRFVKALIGETTRNARKQDAQREKEEKHKTQNIKQKRGPRIRQR